MEEATISIIVRRNGRFVPVEMTELMFKFQPGILVDFVKEALEKSK